jgi:hypothetical protein
MYLQTAKEVHFQLDLKYLWIVSIESRYFNWMLPASLPDSFALVTHLGSRVKESIAQPSTWRRKRRSNTTSSFLIGTSVKNSESSIKAHVWQHWDASK